MTDSNESNNESNFSQQHAAEFNLSEKTIGLIQGYFSNPIEPTEYTREGADQLPFVYAVQVFVEAFINACKDYGMEIAQTRLTYNGDGSAESLSQHEENIHRGLHVTKMVSSLMQNVPGKEELAAITVDPTMNNVTSVTPCHYMTGSGIGAVLKFIPGYQPLLKMWLMTFRDDWKKRGTQSFNTAVQYTVPRIDDQYTPELTFHFIGLSREECDKHVSILLYIAHNELLTLALAKMLGSCIDRKTGEINMSSAQVDARNMVLNSVTISNALIEDWLLAFDLPKFIIQITHDGKMLACRSFNY